MIVPLKHPSVVIPAPTNAQVTEIHRQKQDRKPFNLYNPVFNAVAPKAHRGAIIQNTIISAYLETPHQ